MKKWLSYVLLLSASIFFTTGCVMDIFSPTTLGEGEMTDLVIKFGAKNNPVVNVSTKSELGLVRESNIFNIYIFIFEGNTSTSNKLYGHYFDGSNLNATSEKNYWTVKNMSSDSDPATSGTIHLHTAKKGGCTIVAVANMNPTDLDISAGQLSNIRTYGELQEVVATQVRSEIAANSGYFLMTGQIDGVDILGQTGSPTDITNQYLLLNRLYAKVTFNVRVAQKPDPLDPEKSVSPIRNFIPYKWQVVNIPSCSYLLERATTDVPPSYDDAANSSDELFSTEPIGFETEKLSSNLKDYYNDGKTRVSIHSFSFYMMENRKTPIKTPMGGWNGDTYKYRDMQIKNSDGTNGTFEYANPFSAYVILTGKIVMGYDAGINPNATLDADVRYVIHLGNFNYSNGDFNIIRNHNYIYNIYINGADDIRIEVETEEEKEPGATGRVVVALEEVFDSDCHYSTQVISFHAKYMDPNNISWYVETPFNKNGVGPDDGVDMTEIDYKWVEFRINDKDDVGNFYSNRRVKYKPHNYPDFAELDRLDSRRTFYVDELVDYLKAQKTQYLIDVEEQALDPNYQFKSVFDNDGSEGGPKITVTAFIDEYYYTVNPLSGVYNPTLWKDYAVNQPMRRMHILASSKKSNDKESSLIGSSFTIQQRSIQSIYAIHESAGLQSAWGMEFTDDERETGAATYWRTTDMEDCGNTSSTNGRLNSMKLWGILNPDGSSNLDEKKWDDYLDLTGTNETAQLLPEYNYLRYSCLSRNRDNNGNNIIDPDEIRWYMASDIQLIGVFLGSYGIEGDARLYQRSAADQASADDNIWRQHIIASNRYVFTSNIPDDPLNSNRYARVVWAEEGSNGSHYGYNDDGKTTNFSTRCVRNLGYYLDGEQRKDITLAENPEVEPDAYYTVTRKHLNANGTITSPYNGNYDTQTFYDFDCSRINTASLREPVDHELIGHDENSIMACLSAGFETAPEINLISLKSSHTFNKVTYSLKKIQELNKYLDDSFPDLDKSYSVCPKGYRLPNAREMSLMWTILSAMDKGDSKYLGQGDSNATPARTHWSMGREGSRKKPNKWGWGMSDRHLLMSDYTKEYSKPRCVRDL